MRLTKRPLPHFKKWGWYKMFEDGNGCTTYDDKRRLMLSDDLMWHRLRLWQGMGLIHIITGTPKDTFKTKIIPTPKGEELIKEHRLFFTI